LVSNYSSQHFDFTLVQAVRIGNDLLAPDRALAHLARTKLIKSRLLRLLLVLLQVNHEMACWAWARRASPRFKLLLRTRHAHRQTAGDVSEGLAMVRRGDASRWKVATQRHVPGSCLRSLAKTIAHSRHQVLVTDELRWLRTWGESLRA